MLYIYWREKTIRDWFQITCSGSSPLNSLDENFGAYISCWWFVCFSWSSGYLLGKTKVTLVRFLHGILPELTEVRFVHLLPFSLLLYHLYFYMRVIKTGTFSFYMIPSWCISQVYSHRALFINTNKFVHYIALCCGIAGTWKFSSNSSSKFPDVKKFSGNSVIELFSTPTKINGVHYVQVSDFCCF